ncbi:Histone-lysine N-methyltransferase set-6 [Taxawa tesnikishii (nom. ined.)]|nr:Histone-lysine N-methyltransferase set-6 [Dothideales sp. JES 119]
MTPPILPHSLPSSALFSVRETASSGRGVYATQAIPAGTLLFSTSALAAGVVYREYRKEVCAQCFAYDRGRVWRLRDSRAGVAFCGEACHDEWRRENAAGEAAFVAVEALGKGGKGQTEDGEEEKQSQDERRPTEEEIDTAWMKAEEMADRIRAARSSTQPSKAQRRDLNRVLATQPLRDILSYLLSGVLCSEQEPELWADVLSLAADSKPYTTPTELEFHITSYHHLLAVCPIDLLPYITQATVRTIARNSAHNVFNIWSQDLVSEDEGSQNDTGSAGAPGGSECLGYGMWTTASYWNHSCAPNVRKRRSGRIWQFWAERDVKAGEELCITYLGGDEREMTRGQRRERLSKNWGFLCGCNRCAADDG